MDRATFYRQRCSLAVERIDAIRKQAKELIKLGRNLPQNALSKHGGDHRRQVDIINLKGGTQADYLRARLARDYPDILAQLVNGEFTSVRAAAIAAGIVKVKTPLEQLRSWWRKASENERETFRKEIQ